ncbi:MAG: S41 family peptidase [Oscillospiraceae bacterium]
MKKLLRGLALLLSLTLILTPFADALTPTQAKELLQSTYIDPLPQSAQDATTVADILEALDDPYTQYFSPEEYKAFLASMADTDKVGLGIQFSVTDEGGKIFKVFPDGSAGKGGVVVGDTILSIDGVSIVGKTTAEVQALIAGEAGTSVKLSLLRKDKKTETLTLNRAVFLIPATEAELVDGHIGYLTCTAFGPETYGHFSDAITKYDSVVDHWIVDLRGNGGGDVQAAVNAASAFAGGGDLAYIQDRGGKLSSFVGADKALTIDPVIVLVDEHTASAAELFAAIIRDRQAGLVIGSRTYGKGVAQIMRDKTSDPALFADGSALKITAYRAFSEGLLSHDGSGVLPHLLLSDDTASKAAYLLSAATPGGDNQNYLRLHVGYWRLYVNLTEAQSADYQEAFVALLEALPPSATLYLGAGDAQWTAATVTAVAEKYAPTYKARVFTDLSASPYAKEINTLCTFQILKGSGDGTFRPAANLNRAELCALLAQAMGYKKTEGKSQFTDVPETAWYTPYVNTLSDMGIVGGVGGGRFAPDAPMSHQQFMALLSRTAAGISYTAGTALKEGPKPEDLTPYAGYDSWAQKEVWLLDGLYYDTAKNIAPNAPTTREQAACCLYNMLHGLGVLVG